MAIAVSYPGVYVQTVIQPSPPDSGVATSLAAFVGRAAMGPVNAPTLLNSWGDYQRFFGGLAEDSTVSYQVSAFFNNGGGQAAVVRLFEPVGTDAEVGGAAVTLVGDMKTAVDAYFASTPAGGPTLAGVDEAAEGALASALAGTGYEAGAARRVQSAWQVQSAALATPPTQADADAVFATMADLSYGSAAVLALTLLTPVNDAMTALVKRLALLGGAATRPQIQVSLRSIGNIYSNAAQTVAIAYVGAAVGAAANDPAAAAAAWDSIPKAYSTAIPALASSDPAYAGAVTAVTDADTVLTALGADVAALQTAGYAYQQALVPGITTAAFQANVAAFKPTGAGSASKVLTAVSSATSPAAAVTGVTTAVEAIIPGLSGTPTAAATAAKTALTAYTTAPSGDLSTAMQQAVVVEMMAGVVGDWPAAAGLGLVAQTPGSWGNGLTAAIDATGIDLQVAASVGVADYRDLFNLTVTYTDPNGVSTVESFPNVTLNPAYPALLLSNVLADQSRFVAMPPTTGTPPAIAGLIGAGGDGTGGQDSLELSIMTYLGDQNAKTGIYALENTPIFNILCIPPDTPEGDTDPLIYQTAAEYCVQRNAMLIVDPPIAWRDKYLQGNVPGITLDALGSYGAPEGRTAAVYFPRVVAADPLRNGQLRTFPNSGYMAGLWASTDMQTGVWKAPAGLTAAINGIAGLEVVMSDAENGELNPLGINCLRNFPIGGSVVWGARTLRGAQQLGDQYGYIPVQRLMLYITDWILQNTKWAVFQPNDEAMWSGLRTQISTFLNGLWKQGALFGTSADQAYFVKCDATTTPQSAIDAGIVNVQVGFAPVKPAEFVVVTLQQVLNQS